MNVSGSTTSAVSATGGASRTFRSRASSMHRISHTTVADMVTALQAEFAALRQLKAQLVTIPTEDVLSQLDDGDTSSVNEHRTHLWVADSTSQG